jgi:DNA-binding PadR family transcriptional regulator
MLELSILCFLAERSLHAYELRARISALMGHVRPISDGALYPALRRLQQAKLVEPRGQLRQGGPPATSSG